MEQNLFDKVLVGGTKVFLLLRLHPPFIFLFYVLVFLLLLGWVGHRAPNVAGVLCPLIRRHIGVFVDIVIVTVFVFVYGLAILVGGRAPHHIC